MQFSAKSRAYFLLTLICVLYLFDYADRLVITSFLDSIKKEWLLSDTQLGMLTGVVNLFVAVFVLPLSILVDRWSRTKMIAIMAIVWSIASLSCALVHNYHQLLLFRALTGLGEAAYASAAVALISKTFPRNRRAQYLGIYNAAAPMGAGIGIVIGGIIAANLGWRYSFGLVALPGLLIALLFFTVKDYSTLPIEQQAKESTNTFRNICSSIFNLFKIKTLWYIYIAYAILIGVNTSMLDWSTTYFMRFMGLPQKTASSISGLIAIMVLVGAPLGGILGDKWNRKNKNAYHYFSAITVFISAITLFIALSLKNIPVAMIFFGLFGVFSVCYLAPVTTIIQNVVHPGMRAVSFGINVLFMNLIGAFSFPIIIGKISDYLGLHVSLFFLPVMSLLAGIVFLVSVSQYRRDMQ